MPSTINKTLVSRFERAGQIALDTAVFIYHFEDNPSYRNLTIPMFSLIETGRVQASASILVHTEVLVQPFRINNVELVTGYEKALLAGPTSFTLIPLSPAVSRRAASLRARYGLELADAIHLASALAAKARLFVTNDRQLAKIRELSILVLDDFVS